MAFRNDNFMVPAPPGALRRGRARLPGPPNFSRLVDLDTAFNVAGQTAQTPIAADHDIAVMLERVRGVGPVRVAPRIRAAPESKKYRGTAETGGGGDLPRTNIYMPENGTPILQSAAIDTPLANGTATTVLSYKVPRGQRLIVKSIWNFYTGPGYVQGASPQILWRLSRDGQPFKGFEGFRFLYGSSSAFFALDGDLKVFSEQTFQMVATHEVGSPLPVPATEVIMAFQGWEHPI